MVTEVIYCRHCGSDDVVKNGFAPNNGKQRSTSVAPAGLRAAEILLQTATPKSARKRSCAPTRSVRAYADLGAPLASRRQRLLAGSKKVAALELQETLVQAPGEKVLELDEPWSSVYSKSDKVWVWLALCGRTGQVVAFVMGDRSREQPVSAYGKRSPKAMRRRPATATSGRLTSR